MAAKKDSERRYGKWTEDDLSRCILAVKRGEGLNSATKAFGVPKATLLRHMHNRNKWANDTVKHFGRPTFLPPDLEEDLVKYILDMDRMLFGLSRGDLMKLAFDIADRNGLKHGFNSVKRTAGQDWYKGFLSRHPDICLRQPEATSIARAHGFSKANVMEFFGYLENLIERYSLSATRIFNMDETGISTVHKPPRVLTKRGKSQVGSMTSGERGVTTTGVFCMSAAGQYVPPMLIFKRKRINPQLELGAPAGTLVTCSDSGWMTRETFLVYLQHFISSVKPTKEDAVLLILDGHSSHTKNLEAIDLARQNGVAMLSLPPHTSHRLQPLDVSFFQPLKQAYNRAVTTWMRNNSGKAVTVYQVAHLLNESYCQVASIQNAVRGFEKCGIWPCKRDVFCDSDFVPHITVTAKSPEADALTADVATGQCDSTAASFQVHAEKLPTSEADTDKAPEVTTDPRQTTSMKNDSRSERCESFFAEGTCKVLNTNPDGRCLFRSIAIGLDKDLQTAKRDRNGCPQDARLKAREQLRADKLRADTVDFMMAHIEDYKGLGQDVLNGDQPHGRINFTTIEERLIKMSGPTELPGELELCALSSFLCKPVIVVDAHLKSVVKYNLDKFAGERALYLQFVKLRADVGHYNCVLFTPVRNSPSTSHCPSASNSPSSSYCLKEGESPQRGHCPPASRPDSPLPSHCVPVSVDFQASHCPPTSDSLSVSNDPFTSCPPAVNCSSGERLSVSCSQTPEQSSAGQSLINKRISPEDISPLPKKKPGLLKRLSSQSHSFVITSSPYKEHLAAQARKVIRSPKASKIFKSQIGAKKSSKPKASKDTTSQKTAPEVEDWTCCICCENHEEDMIQCQNTRCNKWAHVAYTAADVNKPYICDICQD